MEHFGERFDLSKQGVYYTPADTNAFLASFGKPGTHRHKKVDYLDLICALDLETTSFRDPGGAALGTMYVWMFGCQGAVMIGRTWSEFEGFFANFCWHFKLSAEKRRVLIYVHNNSFDFQFYRKHFLWADIFARSEREPMYAVTTGGIEFRCSYILTNSKLATVAKNLIRYPVDKQVGDLDYDLIRTPHTPLSEKEIGYCIHDVLVVMSLIYDRVQQEGGNIAKIPLTQTGYARRECRAECLYHDRKARKYLYLMRDLALTEDEYFVAKAAFSGGFTHASPYRVDTVGFNLGSYDFTSSYPAVMVAEKFPMSRGEEVPVETIQSQKDLNKLCDKYCVLMVLEFEDIQATTIQDYYISESRCATVGEDSFNGRIASAESITICCTDVDWEVIRKAYKWNRFRVKRIWTYKRRYLPTPYVRTILQLYKSKTELKNVPGEEENYARSKELLNSLYGMMATQIDRPEVHYEEDEWYSTPVNMSEVLEKYNKDTRRFISYLWGCYVTAYARRNLWSAILTLGGDYWYSDTDSVKVSNYKDHQEYFDNYNTWIQKKLEAACIYHNLPFEYIRPKTQYGKEKPLGVWDYEGEMQRFKTLGAKRYMYTTIEEGEEKLHITCAGVAKKNAVEYLMFKYKTLDAIFKAFEDGLVFPGRYRKGKEWKSGTGKMTHLYYDQEFEVELTDYLGYNETVHELSCINLSNADYNLGIAGMFWEYLKRYWQGIDLKEG